MPSLFRHRLFWPITGIGLIIVSLVVWWTISQRSLPEPKVDQEQTSNIIDKTSEAPAFEVIATKLQVPWEIAFLPSGQALISERKGTVRLFDGKQIAENPVLTLAEVSEFGEGGLLGIAIDPDFASNNQVYFYYSYISSQEEDVRYNRIVKYAYRDGSFGEEQIVFDHIPASRWHNGGRIMFGPDKKLYVTTGDAQNNDLAQDTGSNAGKILRLNSDGSAPNDNPFFDKNPAIYSFGHRNPQGLSWDNTGQLWATEHGADGYDEINKIGAGNNYGWPIFRGDENSSGFQAPIAHSGSSVWAPSGSAFVGTRLFFAGLRGESLLEFETDKNLNASNLVKTHFQKQFGRLRTVVVGPDQLLYVLTNNLDGRGIPQSDDDKLIRINPKLL